MIFQSKKMVGGSAQLEYEQGKYSVESNHGLCVQFLAPSLARYVTFGEFLNSKHYFPQVRVGIGDSMDLMECCEYAVS